MQSQQQLCHSTAHFKCKIIETWNENVQLENNKKEKIK